MDTLYFDFQLLTKFVNRRKSSIRDTYLIQEVYFLIKRNKKSWTHQMNSEEDSTNHILHYYQGKPLYASRPVYGTTIHDPLCESTNLLYLLEGFLITKSKSVKRNFSSNFSRGLLLQRLNHILTNLLFRICLYFTVLSQNGTQKAW